MEEENRDMGNLFLKAGIRTLFFLTRRERAGQKSQRLLHRYLELAEGLDPNNGSRWVQVPSMPGVDEDMRRWSFFMILQHNNIVNRTITATVQQLVQGEGLSGAAVIDPKTDVMPSPSAGAEQLTRLQDSVHEHLEIVSRIEKLRRTRTSPHPLFGDFDAHKWNCMFAFHLTIHYRQAQYVVRALTTAA